MGDHSDIDHTGLTGVGGGSHASTHESGGADEIDVTGLTGAGGSGAVDSIEEQFGTPDTTFEFASSSLTGLTARGTLDAEDADTTVPGHYYAKNANTTEVRGRYATAPSAPFTAITKVTASQIVGGNYQRLGCLFIGEATPGKISGVGLTYDGGWIYGATYWSAPTTPAANIGSGAGSGIPPHVPVYYAIRVNSATSVDYFISFDGRTWVGRALADNPGYTIGAVGVGLMLQGIGEIAAFDYLRIWTSAKTFLYI